MMYVPPNHDVIQSDIAEVFKADLPWASLSGKTILVTGASGMLPAYIVDALMLLPRHIKCVPPKVTALVRNVDKAEKRFAAYLDNPGFLIRSDNICEELELKSYMDTQIIIHAASIPRPDSKKPVDVMAPNVLGTWKLLELAKKLPSFEQFIYFSSGIVNGDDVKSDIPITEEMYFPSSCIGPGACYSEGKRAGETICLSFMQQYDIPVKLLRYFGSYGPGLDLNNDPRSFTSFINSSVNGQDVVMHSTGEETRFWCYITDATDAFFRVLFNTMAGEVWNVANEDAGCLIKELAHTACELSPNKEISVKYDMANVPQGYAPFTCQQITVPDSSKLRGIGYAPKVSVREGLRRTISAYL
jgi:nucleoside-diphosphate-sugar epimerase